MTENYSIGMHWVIFFSAWLTLVMLMNPQEITAIVKNIIGMDINSFIDMKLRSIN